MEKLLRLTGQKVSVITTFEAEGKKMHYIRLLDNEKTNLEYKDAGFLVHGGMFNCVRFRFS